MGYCADSCKLFGLLVVNNDTVTKFSNLGEFNVTKICLLII